MIEEFKGKESLTKAATVYIEKHAVNRVVLELDNQTLQWLRALGKANGTTAPALLEYFANHIADYAGRDPKALAKHVGCLMIAAGYDKTVPPIERHKLHASSFFGIGKAVAP